MYKRQDPKNPKDPKRDRFVLSKGHTAPGLYAALAYRGFFPVEDLPTLRHIDSYLQGHPNICLLYTSTVLNRSASGFPEAAICSGVSIVIGSGRCPTTSSSQSLSLIHISPLLRVGIAVCDNDDEVFPVQRLQ